MTDYKEVGSNIGRGFKDLGVAIYDATGNALSGSGDALYHFSQRKVDARPFFNTGLAKWIAIGAIAFLAYSSCSSGCGGNSISRYTQNTNEIAKVIALEKKVNDLESTLKSQRSCAFLPADHPAKFLGK